MKLHQQHILKTDFLVIGSGIAGLTFALKAAELGNVTVVTKKKLMESNTRYAQGGIAAVFAKDDCVAFHLEDTLNAGVGLCRPVAVEMMVTKAPDAINYLFGLGVPFDQNKNGFNLGKEGGHTKNRIVHVGDHTGFNIETALVNAVVHHPNIQIYEENIAIDLLMNNEEGASSECVGAYILDEHLKVIYKFEAAYTILCTGGIGQIYQHTTNPDIATGDGIGLAYRAGAEIANMEFVQFHPTVLFHQQGNSFLISEALRGAGAELTHADGKAFMLSYHPMGSLAPRDIVSRAIYSEMKKVGVDHVYLDATQIDKNILHNEFPQIYETCFSLGIDVSKDLIPVAPAAHYACGGINSDINGTTNIIWLFAIGETACTGIHGANRLASNSLLEAIVYAHNLFHYILDHIESTNAKINVSLEQKYFSNITPAPALVITELKSSIQKTMNDCAGIVRREADLNVALDTLLHFLSDTEDIFNNYVLCSETIELRNIATTAFLVVKSAAQRKENRGTHYVEGFKTDDENWLKDTLICGLN